MLQRDDLTFKQVARKKRLDRLGQVAILGGSLYGIFAASKFMVLALARQLGRRVSTVAGGLVASLAGAMLLRKLLPFFVPGLAPADVLNKSNSKL